MQTSEQRMQRLPELDWLRALSALAVMLYHYTIQYGLDIGFVEPWPLQAYKGWGAVSAFYFLAAFLSVFTFTPSLTAGRYTLKRVVRLFPAYWAGMLLTTLVTTLFFPRLAPDSETFLINLTMLQGFQNVGNVDGAYWTLAYELRFYAFVALLLLFRQQKNIKWYTLLWVALSFVLYPVRMSGEMRRLVTIPFFWLMPENAAPFASGIFVATLHKNRRDWVAWVGLAGSVGLSLFVQSDGHIVGHLTALTLTGLVLLLRTHPKTAQRYPAALARLCATPLFRCLSWIAALSYPLYLLHQHIGWTIIHALQSRGLTSEWWVLLPIAVAFLLAWLVHRFVEMPCMRLFRSAPNAVKEVL